MVSETDRKGRAGRLMRAAEALSVAGAAGAAGAALLVGRSRAAAALGGAALLAASACTRFGVFHADMRSAEDPKYTVVPQRRRLESGARAVTGEEHHPRGARRRRLARLGRRVTGRAWKAA
jgi:hypothetical protein